MKVLLLNGSANKKGNTFTALSEVARQLENNGVEAAYQTLNMIFEMMNMPVVTSQYWNIAYGLAPGEATQDTEGMQTMRTLADNMAWLLKKIHADGNPDYPEREDWQCMNFIR